MSRNIGLGISPPRDRCDDKNCPYHGTLTVRGRALNGVVASDKMDRTVIVRRDYHIYSSKYKRYERRHSHIAAHNPPCINSREGDKVKIAECRPLAKSVSFVVIEKEG